MKAQKIVQRRWLIGVAVLLGSAASAQETEVVTGTAMYRERIALPPDTVLEATLEDVSRADAPAEVIGQTRLEKAGQPPFRFSIPYDPARIVEGRSYSVRARVTAGGNLMFVTDRAYPVLTRGRGSKVSMMLRRAKPRREMRGRFRYMSDAATFTDCQSGQRWPVAMEGGYKALEAEYLKYQRQPGEDLMVSVEGQVAMRPNMDGGLPTRTLVVERHTGIWPGETCNRPLATAQLQETYWKLTRLEGNPVIVAEKQREPSLVFRTQDSRVTGFGGCNRLTGGYTLNGNQIVFSGVAATRMACIQGMDTEGVFLPALDKVRTWKILGQHLELYDADGNTLARFEARPLK